MQLLFKLYLIPRYQNEVTGCLFCYLYFEVPSQSVSGIMSSNRNLDEFIGFNLVDNKSAS
ncbi:hypothetical protein JCM19236_1425 [Vibrio sp. JCM 19236]|nr:hypothetical protein JCM19236_1425 [Vibrio sp. JCM 19236]